MQQRRVQTKDEYVAYSASQHNFVLLEKGCCKPVTGQQQLAQQVQAFMCSSDVGCE